MTKKAEYDPKSGRPYLHPGRQANIVYDGKVIGYLGEVHPIVAANYNIKDRVYVAVIDMPSIMDETTFDRKYEGIAKFRQQPVISVWLFQKRFLQEISKKYSTARAALT